MAVDTRVKILQAAAKLIVRQGYTATSVCQIAKAAGIGKATVYHHFPDKKAIVMALLERNPVRIQGALDAVKGVSDPRRRIEAIAKASVRLRNESFDLFQVIRRELPDSRPKLHSQLASFLMLYMTQIQEAVHQGIRQGIFRPADPFSAANALLAMLTGLYVQMYLGGGRFPDPEKALASMLEIFFRGIDGR
jgi:AcrR family transcriptional regulator